MADATFKLQDQLDTLAEWASVWQLPIFHLKCCVLTVALAFRHFHQSRMLLMMSTRFSLCVTVSNNLKFALHINNVCCKAHKRYNLLLRCFQSKNVKSLIDMLKCMLDQSYTAQYTLKSKHRNFYL